MNVRRSFKSSTSYLLHSVHVAIFSRQFEGTEIALDGRMGIFITMNPGYAGRTELPESVKALFRPVVCIVPDLQQICEIMLFSEGFLLAKVNSCRIEKCSDKHSSNSCNQTIGSVPPLPVVAA